MWPTCENQTNHVCAGYFQIKLKSITRVKIKSLLEMLILGIQWWAKFRENFNMTRLDIDSKDGIYYQ